MAHAALMANAHLTTRVPFAPTRMEPSNVHVSKWWWWWLSSSLAMCNSKLSPKLFSTIPQFYVEITTNNRTKFEFLLSCHANAQHLIKRVVSSFLHAVHMQVWNTRMLYFGEHVWKQLTQQHWIPQSCTTNFPLRNTKIACNTTRSENNIKS